jgi:hypothetical protein
MVVEIAREFGSASKDFASFSKFFLGGFVGFQRVAVEKIWIRVFSWNGRVLSQDRAGDHKGTPENNSTTLDFQKELVWIFLRMARPPGREAPSPACGPGA